MYSLIGTWQKNSNGDTFFRFNEDGTFETNFMGSEGLTNGTYTYDGTALMLVCSTVGMVFDVYVKEDRARFTYPSGQEVAFLRKGDT